MPFRIISEQEFCDRKASNKWYAITLIETYYRGGKLFEVWTHKWLNGNVTKALVARGTKRKGLIARYERHKSALNRQAAPIHR